MPGQAADLSPRELADLRTLTGADTHRSASSRLLAMCQREECVTESAIHH